MDPFETSLLQTLSYFDIFNCPLTVEELYSYQWKGKKEFSFFQFSEEINRLVHLESFPLERKNGFYFLRGREEIVDVRGNRVWYIEKKMSLAKQAARLVRYIPGVKALFVCNQIQIGVTQKSDIDVLIIIEPGCLYSTRLLVTLLLGAFRLRRHGKKITNRICLSFYVTHDALDFSSLRIQGEDIYFIHWLGTLLPVYDSKNFFGKIKENNLWMQEYLPIAFEKDTLLHDWKVEDTTFSRWLTKAGEKFFSTRLGKKFEASSKKIQTRHMQKNTKSVQSESDNRVVVSDTILKFHENDRREIFQEQWENKWKNFIL